MTTIKAGEIWIAAIPFTNGIASKKRPVLILWDDGNDVVLAAVTSAKPRTQTDVVLKNWANSGLRVESTVRLSRLDCIEKSLMISKLGKLSVEDANKLKEIWTNYVKPQF
jgi:mRNA interferase MazF